MGWVFYHNSITGTTQSSNISLVPEKVTACRYDLFPQKTSSCVSPETDFACCCWIVALPWDEKATMLSGGESLWTLTTLFRLIIDFRPLRGISSDEFRSQKVTGNVSFGSLLSALWPIWFLLSLPDAVKYKQCSSCSWCQSSCDCYFPWLKVISGLLTCFPIKSKTGGH